MIPGAQRINAGWGEIHVDLEGAGLPLLLLQGLGYASWAWPGRKGWLPHWMRVSVDNRGTGRSSKPEGTYSIAGMADDAALVLDALGAPSAHVLGFSMGGYIALTLAIERPELVRSLIIVGSSGGGPGHEPTPVSTSEAWLSAADLGPEQHARATMPLSFSSGWPDAHRYEYETLLRARLDQPTPTHAWNSQYRACEEYLDRGVEVERVRASTLIVHGEADRVVPVSNGRRLHARMPDSEMVSMEERGHLCYIEDPDRFDRSVTEFLLRVEDRDDG